MYYKGHNLRDVTLETGYDPRTVLENVDKNKCKPHQPTFVMGSFKETEYDFQNVRCGVTFPNALKTTSSVLKRCIHQKHRKQPSLSGDLSLSKSDLIHSHGGEPVKTCLGS